MLAAVVVGVGGGTDFSFVSRLSTPVNTMTTINGSQASPMSHFPKVGNPGRCLIRKVYGVGILGTGTSLIPFSIIDIISAFCLSISAWIRRVLCTRRELIHAISMSIAEMTKLIKIMFILNIRILNHTPILSWAYSMMCCVILIL